MLESPRAEELLARFRAHAEALFAARPELRSVMAVVAQYFNDHAHDCVHFHILASPRDIPVWPHECSAPDSTEDAVYGDTGERCEGCDAALYLSADDSWYWNAFESYCHEHGANSDLAVDFLPIAIARRGELIWVGRKQRPQNDVMPASAELDARELALLAQLREDPDDDAIRAVLADHRLERGLAPRAALGAVGAAIGAGCAAFERGLLVGADVYAVDQTARDHPAWSTVRTLRYLPNSADLTCATMVSLRELGPIRADGARSLAGGHARLERLHVVGAEALAALAPDRFPRLRELIVEDVLDLALLQRWRGRLDRLVLARANRPLPSYGIGAIAPGFTAWPRPAEALRAALDVPVLASCDVSQESAGPTGIEVAFAEGRTELRVVGWDPYARLEDIAAAVTACGRDVTYASSPYRIFVDSDADRVAWRS